MNISRSSNEVHKEPRALLGIGVLAGDSEEHTRELLGDARELADRLDQQVIVLRCSDSVSQPEHAESLIEHGADEVVLVTCGAASATSATPHPLCSFATRLKAVEQWYRTAQPRILFVPASGTGRSLAARLAVRCDTELFSPALLARVHHDRLQVTALHWDGRRARQVELAANRAAILVVNKDVGQARRADKSRTGSVRFLTAVAAEPEAVVAARRVEADPAEASIEHLPRLVAGGFGVGSREGFQLLRSVAARLSAGVAASRMAVDCGWIERERQVGQTGKNVRPELYLACGISGASHHLEGMSQSRHILAINTDPQAPIFRVAHLGLVADWRQTLLKFESMLPLPGNAVE
jgi:electron transfer flavoprotein alpha subunit